MWVWGIKPRSLGRVVSALHRWAVSQPSSSLWFLDTLFCVKHEQETTNKKAPSHFVLIFFPFLWNKATLCKGKDSEYLGNTQFPRTGTYQFTPWKGAGVFLVQEGDKCAKDTVVTTDWKTNPPPEENCGACSFHTDPQNNLSLFTIVNAHTILK